MCCEIMLHEVIFTIEIVACYPFTRTITNWVHVDCLSKMNRTKPIKHIQCIGPSHTQTPMHKQSHGTLLQLFPWQQPGAPAHSPKRKKTLPQEIPPPHPQCISACLSPQSVHNLFLSVTPTVYCANSDFRNLVIFPLFR